MYSISIVQKTIFSFLLFINSLMKQNHGWLINQCPTFCLINLLYQARLYLETIDSRLLGEKNPFVQLLPSGLPAVCSCSLVCSLCCLTCDNCHNLSATPLIYQQRSSACKQQSTMIVFGGLQDMKRGRESFYLQS